MRTFIQRRAKTVFLIFTLALVGVVVIGNFYLPNFNVSFFGTVQAKSGPSLNLDVAGLYLFFDHGLYPGGLKASKDNLGIITGSHNMFPWRAVEPSPGQYNFEAIDRWLNQVGALGKKAMFGVEFRCEGYGGVADDGCTPWWALDNAYDPVVVPNPGGNCNIGAKKRLNYLNPGIQKRMKAMIQALADHYRNDPRIGVIMIPSGFNGEPKPQPSSTVYCYRDAERQAYERKGYTSDRWSNYNASLIDMYAQAFGNSQKMVVIITGTWQSHWENVIRTQEAVKRSIGVHNSGLTADFSSGDSFEGQCTDTFESDRAYAAMWPAAERNGEKVVASFEPHHGSDHRGLLGDGQALDQRSYTWWSVLNALDKRASVITPYSESINAKWQTWGKGKESPQWQWRDLDAWQFAVKYLGRTYQDTPDAWVAFRTSFNRYCGDNTDYDFYLKPIDNYRYPRTGHADDNGHYAGETSQEAVKLGDNRPNKVGWIGPRNDWRGAYGREISEKYPEIVLDLDDRIQKRVSAASRFQVTFYDGESHDQGKEWLLKYTTNQGSKTKKFTLGGSGRWRVETVYLDGLVNDNQLNGGDIAFVKSGGKTGPIYFHFASLSLASAPTLAPTQKPKPTQTHCRPGDFNCDGRIDLLDLNLLLRHLNLF